MDSKIYLVDSLTLFNKSSETNEKVGPESNNTRVSCESIERIPKTTSGGL
jgi:hypothetical protein